jgi:hypothetical protein
MNRRKALQVVLTIVALGALGAWSYSSAPASSALAGASSSTTPGKSSTTAAPHKKKKNGHNKTSTSTVPSGPTTTVAPNPAAYSTALFGDWKGGDRDSAGKVATAAVVKELFLRPWHSADAWVVTGCQGTAGSTYCTWTSPRRRFVMQVRNATGGLPVLIVGMQIFH